MIDVDLDQSCESCQVGLSQSNREIYRALFIKLQKKLELYDRQSHFDINRNEGGAFKQLVKVIFNKQSKQNCSHQKLEKYFLKTLACTYDSFNFICQRLAQQIAQRNYHLQLISLQFKNSVESVAEIYARNKSVEKSQQQHVLERVARQSNKKMEKEISVKIESELMKTEPDFQQMQKDNRESYEMGMNMRGTGIFYVPMSLYLPSNQQ